MCKHPSQDHWVPYRKHLYVSVMLSLFWTQWRSYPQGLWSILHAAPSITESPLPLQRIILGIDPGTTVMGYGVIQQAQQQLQAIQYGVIHLHRYTTHALKLQKIFERILAVVDDFKPDEVALEAPFYGKNIQSMLKLGRAQGVAMAAALAREVPITEYAPRKVKQAVTGNGHASKEQVAHMLMSLLQLPQMPDLLDASDALAVAVCHAYQNKSAHNKPASWEQFLKQYPDRIHPNWQNKVSMNKRNA